MYHINNYLFITYIVTSKPKSTLTIEELGVTKLKGERQKLGSRQQFIYDLIKERLRALNDIGKWTIIIFDLLRTEYAM